MSQHVWMPQDSSLEFAWVPSAHHLIEPVRATPLYGDHDLWDAITDFHPPSVAPTLTVTQVTLHHPDVGPVASKVSFSDLRGLWNSRPQPALVEATGWDPDRPWAQIAEERHSWARRERHLADRLTELGIHRARRHYAGRGGTSTLPHQLDAKLILDHEELLRLVDLADKGNS